MLTSMKPPLFVRPLTEEERHHLEGGLRSQHAFTLRRCPIVLASAQRHTPAQIATHVGCSVQTVRNTLQAFAQHGLRSISGPTLAFWRSCIPGASSSTTIPTFTAWYQVAVWLPMARVGRPVGQAFFCRSAS